jgi:neutral ceramidase
MPTPDLNHEFLLHLHRRLSLLFSLGLVFFLTSAHESEATWKAGMAKVNITPDDPVRLSGYGSRTTAHEGVEMPLYAKALALTWSDDPPVVMLTVDNCGVPAAMRSEVLKRVNQAGWKLADERFSLHSSHTHCAPALPGMLPFLFSQPMSPAEEGKVQQYGIFLIAKMTDAVITALNQQGPAEVARGLGKVGFAMNRRLPTEAGFTNAPNFNGPVDHTLPVLRVRSPDGSLKAVLTSYACHCTTLGINKTHPDWAGWAQRELEFRYPGAIALTAIGCGADQNPYPRRELEHARLHGCSLAAEAAKVIASELKPIMGPVSCIVKEVMLPYDTLPDEAGWQSRAQDKNPWIARHARYFLSLIQRGEKPPAALPYKVQAWTFGESLLMINLPGEVVVDYGLRFKREFDPARTWVNAYTNDVPCYIPSQRVWEEGGYEAAGAMVYYGRPARFATGIENIITRAVSSMVPPVFKVLNQ